MNDLGFTEEEIQRYARHITLPQVGGTGQRKLIDSKVLVIGAGGLGSPVLLYLAAAGVGTIGIIDDDKVELSPVELRQFIISYDIFENYELLTGISFLSYDYRAYDYSDDNDLTNDDDYDLSEENVNLKLHLNMGFGYKF